MIISKAERQLIAQKEMAEMEAMMQEGAATPTQSSDDSPEGSPERASEGTTEQAFQELEAPDTSDVVDPFGQDEQTEPVQDLAYWKDRALVSEKRFNVSKPKYDSNIYKLRTENSQLLAEKIELAKQLNQLRQASRAESPAESILDSKQIVDVLGQETADAIRKSIETTNARVDAQAKSQAERDIAEAEARLKITNERKYNDFLRDLSELVPDQAVINKDPKFIEYLRQPDEHLGVERFELLREAEGKGNATRVASFFKSFKKASKQAPGDSINKRIAPNSKASPTTDLHTNTGGKISAKYIDKFFADVNKGVYKGRYKEQQAIQSKIDEAYMSGNITN